MNRMIRNLFLGMIVMMPYSTYCKRIRYKKYDFTLKNTTDQEIKLRLKDVRGSVGVICKGSWYQVTLPPAQPGKPTSKSIRACCLTLVQVWVHNDWEKYREVTGRSVTGFMLDSQYKTIWENQSNPKCGGTGVIAKDGAKYAKLPVVQSYKISW